MHEFSHELVNCACEQVDSTHKLELCSNLALKGFKQSVVQRNRNIPSPHLPIARLCQFVHIFTFSQTYYGFS